MLPWRLRNVPVIGQQIIHWTSVSEHLAHGCLNPSKIIDAERNLVATFTSLNAVGEGSFPVIKLTEERLDLIESEKVVDGSTFAAAATYVRTDESWREGRWDDFLPIVVDCLVDEPQQCESAKRMLSPLAWKALELGIHELDGFEEGLYCVDVPHEVVWNAY